MLDFFVQNRGKKPGRFFLMSGVLGRRRGPDDYVLFPNEKREDEGARSGHIRDFSLGFHSVTGTVAH